MQWRRQELNEILLSRTGSFMLYTFISYTSCIEMKWNKVSVLDGAWHCCTRGLVVIYNMQDWLNCLLAHNAELHEPGQPANVRYWAATFYGRNKLNTKLPYNVNYKRSLQFQWQTTYLYSMMMSTLSLDNNFCWDGLSTSEQKTIPRSQWRDINVHTIAPLPWLWLWLQ